MAENTAEPQVKNPERRQLFKKGFMLLAGSAAVGAAGKGAAVETEVGKEGIRTSAGVFYPLEERHSARRKLPDNLPLDALFREVLPKFEIDAAPRLSTIPEVSISEPFLSNGPVKVWSPDLLEQLSRRGIPVILGDVEYRRN